MMSFEKERLLDSGVGGKKRALQYTIDPRALVDLGYVKTAPYGFVPLLYIKGRICFFRVSEEAKDLELYGLLSKIKPEEKRQAQQKALLETRERTLLSLSDPSRRQDFAWFLAEWIVKKTIPASSAQDLLNRQFDNLYYSWNIRYKEDAKKRDALDVFTKLPRHDHKQTYPTQDIPKREPYLGKASVEPALEFFKRVYREDIEKGSITFSLLRAEDKNLYFAMNRLRNNGLDLSKFIKDVPQKRGPKLKDDGIDEAALDPADIRDQALLERVAQRRSGRARQALHRAKNNPR